MTKPEQVLRPQADAGDVYGDGRYPSGLVVRKDRNADFLRLALSVVAAFILALVAIALGTVLLTSPRAHARDDGRYAGMDPVLHAWFDRLASGKGLCCSFADGFAIEDVDWDTQGGKYRVRLDGEWTVVPDSAVVTEPNKYGRAVVWPYMDADGATQIRCFLPGAGT